MDNIDVLVADDHTIVRKGLVSLLKDEKRVDKVLEAKDGKDALNCYQSHEPDIAIIDLSMPNLNGIEATRRIMREYPQAKILILTVHSEKEYIAQMLEAGASGYIIKKSAPSELIEAIDTIMKGEVYLSPSISKVVVKEYFQKNKFNLDKDLYEELTDREREILQLIAEGNTTEEISSKLYISKNTVATHRRNIMKKLDLHNIAELTKYAIQHGIVSDK